MDVHYALPENRNRLVAFNEEKCWPIDTYYQPESARIPAQHHY